jgi:hypothetical protein
MAVYVTKRMGYFVQLWVLYVIHALTYYDGLVFYDAIAESGRFAGAFHYITGWPIYAAVLMSYAASCLKSAGAPPDYLRFAAIQYPACDKCVG